MRHFICMLFLGFTAMSNIFAQEKVGERPYEMVWANRTKDTHPPQVDFESLDGWKVETQDAVATFTRSREQQLWDMYVGKLVYRGTSRKATLTIRPPQPIPVPADADCVNFWVYGNNWAWMPDASTPSVGIHLLLRAADGAELNIRMGSVNWKEWWVMHRKLQPEQLDIVKRGAKLEGIQITNCHNKDDRLLYFDNIAFYKEQLPPLTFEPRPRRGIEMFPGQGCGTNTGPGRLPFPTREETILPDNLTRDFTTSLTQSGKAFVFKYKGADGELEYRYEPKTGTLGDVSVTWGGLFGKKFRPMVDGGLRFAVEKDKEKQSLPPDRAELISCNREGETVASTWRLFLSDQTMDATYTFRLWQKSLVVDVKCLGGKVSEFVIGRATGVENPRLVTIPYLVGEAARPAVLVMGKPDKPLFLMALMDYYRSNASALTFVNDIKPDGVTYNGGSVYIPKTDGKRNDCFERLFLTVSPRFEEILPNIPNPKSPWMHVAGERLWIAHGASNREKDYAIWEERARYGMTKVVITDHETGWRDGGESFTFRTRAAPKKGGDPAQAEYSRKLHALGYRYGIYNNYTDFAPVNEYWDEDMVTRTPDGNWRTAWPRCYNPKPARAVEFEAKLTPIIQEKFKLSTAYCDVHTAVTPWGYVDYDARVPGAGTFAATFYAYGEIMLHQKKVWNGPVYSEGNNHYYYCGLTDGNYAQDQRYRIPHNPWLVDFDLRKMHPLCCNFGMGSPGMFYGEKTSRGDTPQERERYLDRFLAATIAFGHPGFFVGGPIRHQVRAYYTIQQLHANYTQATASTIQYADEKGNLLDTTQAVATGAYTRSQVVTTYSNGLKVWVNGHPSETWKTPEALLPPNGWYARSADGKLISFSGLKDGHRADYVHSDAYIYCDGRGVFSRFEKAACDEAVIALKRDDGKVEIIPVDNPKSFGVSLDGKSATAIALDKARKELGPVEVRMSRGLVYVAPKEGAFSYLLTPTDPPTISLTCDRDRVVPGETVTIQGKTAHTFRIPLDAKPRERLWQQFEGAWIDFTVLPLVDASLSLDAQFNITLRSNLNDKLAGTASFEGQTQPVTLLPNKEVCLQFAVTPPVKEEVREVKLQLRLGEYTFERSWWLKAERIMQVLAKLSEKFDSGMCIRKGTDTSITTESGALVRPDSEMSCGSRTKKGIFMHPPYKTGVGYAFALFDPITLPREPAAIFRCFVGKRDGGDVGDGILFQVAVIDGWGRQHIVAQKQWVKYAWTPFEADLSPWAGQKIRLKLISDVGPADDSIADWACWAEMRIETRSPTMVLTVHEQPVTLRYEPGPYPVPNLRIEDLRKAKRGWFHYEAVGLEASAPYISNAEINSIPIGNLPGSEGCNERENIWSKVMSMELPREAIESLSACNRITINNPGNDSFKIRRFWIELELADGRKCSSKIENLTYSQPPNWTYAEGIGIKFGEPIEGSVLFELIE